MSPRPRRRLFRCAAWSLGALALGLLLGGCVYFRLLEFKHQLADFDRHFSLQTDDGLRLACRDPLLLADDLRWLGLTPELVDTAGNRELWHIRWTKELPPGAKKEPPKYDVEMSLAFVDGKLVNVALPERYFVFVPKSFFIGLLRNLGSASVNEAKRTASVEFSAAERQLMAQRVMIASLAMLLGQPTERRIADGHTYLRYHYTPVPAGAKNGNIDMIFTFDSGNGQLTHLDGRSPVGQLSFNFEAPTAAAAATGGQK